ncbi:MAG: hypothetical protein GY847_20820 [Proteobacteria bacterium]|nr:hypothetical protein [Pseudomonadota bacterium]
MTNRIGIRREDKNEWERRVPLVPADVMELIAEGINIQVERSFNRSFNDAVYAESKAILADNSLDSDLVLGVKEMPVDYFEPNKAYMFFSHTIKGQPYNMKMLAGLVDKKCTLLDYELVTDETGRRLIFFGRYAGLAGMIDTLWTMGRRLSALGFETPFLEIEPTLEYTDLDEVKKAVVKAGNHIETYGLQEELAPFAVGFTGYGNVSKGAQEIFDLLPHVEVAPEDLSQFIEENSGLQRKLIKVVYHENHLVEPTNPSNPFDLNEYYDNPERYRSIFEPHLELLTVLVNGIYWEERYPKLADAKQLEKLFLGGKCPRLVVVGDITCDVDGSIACTVRETNPGDPVFVYDPVTRKAPSGFYGPGLAVMAVGNLPTELPREASTEFSRALKPFVPALGEVDFSGSFNDARLPDPIRRAVILWKGEFTPDYQYMQDFLC